MSNQSIPSATNGPAEPPVETTDPAATPTPTITHHQQLAMEFRKGFRELVKIVPGVMIPHPITKAFVDSHLNVAQPFLNEVIVSVENDPALQGVDKVDTNDGRDALQYSDAWSEIVKEVLQFGTNLGFTIDSRLANFSVGARQVYAVAKALARDPNAGVTAVHAANMKREFKRNAGRGKGKKKKAPAPTSPATPAPTEGKPA
jgi:hypothetical protein